MTGSQWRSSLHRADAIAAAVIACQAAVLAFISLSGSWFQDDLRAMSQAAAYGWSSDWLFGAGVGGTHFSPLTRAWFTLLDVIAPMNRPVAVATVVVMQAATSALLWWLCRRLGVRSGPALLVLAVYALSPLTLTSLAWTIQAVQFVPVHLGLLIAAHGQLSYIRTRQPRWILLSLAGVCVGLLAWEKTLAGLGLLVLLAPLWTGTVRQSRLRPVLNLWPLVLSYGALAVLYLAGELAGTAPAKPQLAVPQSSRRWPPRGGRRSALVCWPARGSGTSWGKPTSSRLLEPQPLSESPRC